MGRSGGRSGGGGGGFRGAPAPRRGFSSAAPARNLPARAPAAPPPAPMAAAAPQAQQPGLMAQMAATAGGVAIGSAIGHTVGHAMTGMFSGGGSSEAAPAPEQAVSQQYQPVAQHGSEQATGPCAWEIKQFLECASSQADLTLCQGFNEAIQQCKTRNNLA